MKFNQYSNMGKYLEGYKDNIEEIWTNTITLSILDMSIFKTRYSYTGLALCIYKCDYQKAVLSVKTL